MESLNKRTEEADSDQFEAGHEDFMKCRTEGIRNRWVVMHPYTGEHVDAVDYQAEIDLRHEAGLEGYGFWSTPLPEVDNQ